MGADSLRARKEETEPNCSGPNYCSYMYSDVVMCIQELQLLLLVINKYVVEDCK
jgi:hypothetical protein